MCCLCAQLCSPFVTPAIFQGTSRWHLSKLLHLGSPYSWWHIPTSVASHCCWMENADGSIALTFPHFLFFLSANHAKFYQKNPSGLNNRDIKKKYSFEGEIFINIICTMYTISIFENFYNIVEKSCFYSQIFQFYWIKMYIIHRFTKWFV